jgi:hypothetical protein
MHEPLIPLVKHILVAAASLVAIINLTQQNWWLAAVYGLLRSYCHSRISYGGSACWQVKGRISSFSGYTLHPGGG